MIYTVLPTENRVHSIQFLEYVQHATLKLRLNNELLYEKIIFTESLLTN